MDCVARGMLPSASYPDGSGPINTLVKNALQEIFKRLHGRDLYVCAQVCRKWKLLVSDKAVRPFVLPTAAFGPEEWATYFGHVDAPAVPLDIHALLKSPCPFWPDKKIGETHMLVLIPESVNGRPMTLRYLRELIDTHRNAGTSLPGIPAKFEDIWQPILDQLGDTPIEESHYVLMTREPIPGSRNKSYAVQQALVVAQPGYRVPKLLETAICILMQNIRSKPHSYSRNPWTYIRCEEQVHLLTARYQLVVGGFAPLLGGLLVFSHDFGREDFGVAGLRMF